MVRNIRRYAKTVILFALIMGIMSTGRAMETGPVDILQKKEQSEAVTVYTPILTGLSDAEVESSLNQLLANDIQHGLDSFLLTWSKRQWANGQLTVKPKFVADYAEKFNRSGILSITIQQYKRFDKSTEKIMSAYTVNTDTGKVYNLFQLFRPAVDYNSRLEEIIKKESALFHSKYPVKHLTDLQTFYLTEEGLVIYYKPYELSPKQTEIVRFVIPYDLIRDMLSPELPL